MARILIIDDDVAFMEIFKERMELDNYQVAFSEDCEHCLEAVEAAQPEIIFLDIDFGVNDKRAGIEALKKLRKKYSKQELPVVMLSGTGDTSILVKTLEMGANDFDYKPITEYKEFIEKVAGILSAIDETQSFGIQKEQEWILGGKSTRILDITKQIYRAAQANMDTLFEGETGVGKEVAARMYHQHSNRRNSTMINVNCPGIPSELFESELFGYTKGAFANATRDHMGLVEKAENGILFFDEIGHLSLSHQTKLLRFIQFKTFRRVGSNTEKKVDVIILAATSRNLREMVRKGGFLQELFYRFEKNIMTIPSLRERREDITYLTKDLFALNNHKNIKEIDQEVLDVFQQMKWDGNVRQLENCIVRGIHRCSGNTLGLKDVEGALASHESSEDDPVGLIQSRLQQMKYTEFSEFEKEQEFKIRKAFYGFHYERHQKKITQTANYLGMKPEYLRQVLKKLQLLS
ncbi:sigma-54 dependent transcriptional regulator [bacterium]|nr:sigma-54 dependent transcriptional regulator [bacterium]